MFNIFTLLLLQQFYLMTSAKTLTISLPITNALVEVTNRSIKYLSGLAPHTGTLLASL